MHDKCFYVLKGGFHCFGFYVQLRMWGGVVKHGRIFSFFSETWLGSQFLVGGGQVGKFSRGGVSFALVEFE